MYPDITHGFVGNEKLTSKVDHAWVDTYFNPKVGKRGAEIIAARKLSSAASAGNAAIEHIRDWALGTSGKWTSMGVTSNGNPYKVPENLVFSFPVTTNNGEWEIVKGLTVDEYS